MDEINIFLPFFVFLVGTIIGSFCNVCIYRLPKKRSIVLPGSFCPRCETPIRPIDNIPLISFILLRGRCRNCRERIPYKYPMVELFTGISFLS
ncbi:MAG: A24 family peptidase, partial [Nitrospinota bacterium]